MTRFGNFGVKKNSRMARRYATPATDSGMMGNASPWPLNLRAQMVSATSIDDAEPVQPAGWSELHRSPVPVRNCAPLLLPLFQPRRRSRRPGRSKPEFRGKASQVVLQVNVVEGICEANGKLQPTSARQQGVERAVGSHPVAMEKRGMGSLRPNEIIAAVMCRSNNHVVRGEHLERARENRNRQMRAVAVEGNDALPARRCEVCKHRGQAAARPSPCCATTPVSPPANCASSSTSEAGHIMATFTLRNECASAMVSSRRQR